MALCSGAAVRNNSYLQSGVLGGVASDSPTGDVYVISMTSGRKDVHREWAGCMRNDVRFCEIGGTLRTNILSPASLPEGHAVSHRIAG